MKNAREINPNELFPVDRKMAKSAVVIGHFPDYQLAARAIGCCYFELNIDDMARLTEQEIWRRNEVFLNDRMRRGARFLLATAPELARPGSWFARELEYLDSVGASPVRLKQMKF